MYGYPTASSAFAYLGLAILLIGRMISPGYTSIDNITTIEDVAIEPSTDVNASSAKKIECTVQKQQPEQAEMEHHESTGNAGINEASTALNPKRKVGPKNKSQAVNLMGGMVEFRRDAMIKLDEVFGMVPKKGKQRPHVKPLKIDESRRQLANQERNFLEYHASKADGKTEWGNKSNLRLIFLMGVIMKIHDRRSFSGIEFIKPEHYDELKIFFEESKTQWLEAESVISRLFEDDKLEATRRIFAFRSLLHHHTSAKRWADRLAHLTPMARERMRHVIDLIEKTYGISAHPERYMKNASTIPVKKWDLDANLGLPGTWKLRKILVEVFGETEATRRQKLNDYKMDRMEFTILWSYELGLFTPHKFAIDTLTLWKVGDALQGCWNFLIDGANARMRFDEAFAQLLGIFTDKERLFSWPASPERAWMIARYGKGYRERLAKLSNSIILSEKTNPLSTSAVKDLVGDIGMMEGNQRAGLEIMFWCELGLDPKEWPRIGKLRNSQDWGEFRSTIRGMEKISNKERENLEVWNQMVSSYSNDNKPSSVLWRINDNFWQWQDQYITPFKVIRAYCWSPVIEILKNMNIWPLPSPYSKSRCASGDQAGRFGR